MISFEQVEKLAEKTGSTFEDAKAALEASDGDMLDAVITLERQNKVEPPVGNGSYSTTDETGTETDHHGYNKAHAKREGASFSETMGRFFRWCGRWVGKGNRNYLDVDKNGSTIVSFPVTALVLCLIFLFWVTIPLLIVSLFSGCRLSFRGAELGRDEVNDFMNKASNVAENVKREVINEFDKKNDE